MVLRLVVLGLVAMVGVAGAQGTKPPCTTLRHCAKLCSTKNKQACDRLDELVQTAIEYDPNEASTKDLLPIAKRSAAAACKSKYKRSCATAALIDYFNGVNSGAAEGQLNSACAAKVGEACYALAKRYDVLKDDDSQEDAADNYEAGCEAGYKVSCVYAISKSADDPKTQVKKLDELCTGGEGYACFIAATVYTKGMTGVPPDPQKATTSRQRSCELGESLACEDIAQGLKDAKARMAVLRKGCDAGRDVTDCAAAEKEAITANDTEALIAIRQRACDLGGLTRCIDLETDVRQAGDTKRANALRDLICVAGTADDCRHVKLTAAKASNAK